MHLTGTDTTWFVGGLSMRRFDLGKLPSFPDDEKPLILHINDQDVILDTFEQTILGGVYFSEEHPFAVLPAHSISLGLLYAYLRPPDLIITDLKNLALNGLAGTRALKSHPRTRSIPVAIQTAADDYEEQAFAAGADYFFSRADFEDWERLFKDLGYRTA